MKNPKLKQLESFHCFNLIINQNLFIVLISNNFFYLMAKIDAFNFSYLEITSAQSFCIESVQSRIGTPVKLAAILSIRKIGLI